MKKISVIKKMFGSEAELMFIDNTLESLQEQVQGFIEPVFPQELDKHGVMMYVDEDGWAKNLPVNIYDESYGPIRGTLLFVTSESGGNLTDKQRIKIAQYLDYSHVTEEDSKVFGSIRYGYGRGRS